MCMIYIYTQDNGPQLVSAAALACMHTYNLQTHT